MRLYIGPYTRTTTGGHRPEAIFHFDLDADCGALTPTGITGGIRNPSYLAFSPQGSCLYAVSETGDSPQERSGGAAAFAVEPGGALVLLNQQVTLGAAPCYVSTDRSGRWLFAANYHSGTLTVFPIQPGGGLAPACQVIQHEGSSVVTPNQDSAHAHSILPDPGNRWVLAADLGMDQVKVYRFDSSSGLLSAHSAAAFHAGAGPRHIVFHPNQHWVFVCNELDSTVTALSWNAALGELVEMFTLPTLPQDAAPTRNAVADLHLTPDGRHLYVSNRGHNSLAHFAVDQGSGMLSALGHTPSGGDWPRGFAISPDGRWLVCAHQHSGEVSVFAVHPVTGALSRISQQASVPAGVCVKFG